MCRDESLQIATYKLHQVNQQKTENKRKIRKKTSLPGHRECRVETFSFVSRFSSLLVPIPYRRLYQLDEALVAWRGTPSRHGKIVEVA